MIFVRAFLISLAVGAPASAQSTDDLDWSRTVELGTADAYFWYLRRNPTGQYIDDAIVELRRLGLLETFDFSPSAGGADVIVGPVEPDDPGTEPEPAPGPDPDPDPVDDPGDDPY